MGYYRLLLNSDRSVELSHQKSPPTCKHNDSASAWNAKRRRISAASLLKADRLDDSEFSSAIASSGLNVDEIQILVKSSIKLKLTSQFHQFRPQSRKNEISEISPGQKCVLQIEMSNSRISCTLNEKRRSY